MNKKHIIRTKKSSNKIIKPTETQAEKKSIKIKISKPKKEKHRTSAKVVLERVLKVIATVICVCFVGGVVFLLIMLQGKPKLDPNDFITQESSIVYDRNGEVISELGQTIRKNVVYDDLPTSLIDAFVAVEDSRFFEHNGFDIPRFTKAFFSNLRTMSFGQGGSTFTMQLIKNTYFVDDTAGVGAAKSIKRKVQEIALAIELENNPAISKKDIFTAYLNKLYFGGTYQNIRGVQKAAEYYFGKQVNELTLPESAMLAGVINAPNLYNPYNYLEYAQERRDEVLYLMYYHGYISENEYDVAIKTKVQDLLYDSSSKKKNEGSGTQYQAYIDQVVDEVYELTGLDPYTTTMRIYTAMDKTIQTKMDEIQAEKVDDKYYYKTKDGENYFYPDDKFEVASICVDNNTGEIYGIMGGRNYAKGGALLLNHATQQKKQPGSSIKPILDYSQAFEVLGWSTSHYVVDKPVTYPGTGILIGNSNGYYQGDMSLKDAVFESLNTPAIFALDELINDPNAGKQYLANYMLSIGYDIDPNDFNVQYGIGGGNLEVTCLQMAGAQAMLINHGKYNKPHAVTKIEFLNEKAPYIYESETVQALSPEAAYLTTELLKNNVSGDARKEDGSHYANLMELLQSSYPVYAKTGTTNWDSSAKVYGIPNGSIKDGWTIASTSKVTIATWIGYEKAEKEDDVVYGYMPYSIYNRNLKGKITRMLLNSSVDALGEPEAVAEPDDIMSISHIKIPGKPYVSPIEGMDEQYIVTGLIKKSAYSLTDPQDVGIEPMNGTVSIAISNGILNVQMPSYPNPNSIAGAEHKYDISLYNSDGNLLFFSEPLYGNKSFDYSWLYGSIKYKVDLKKNGTVFDTLAFDSENVNIDIASYLNNGTLVDGDKISVTCYYGFENLNLNSNKVDSSELVIDDKVTINIPSTIDEAYALLLAYYPNITKTSQPLGSASPSLGGTVVSITLSNGTQIGVGQQTINKSLLNGANILYYDMPIPTSINITISGTEIGSDPIVITATISNYTYNATDSVLWTVIKDNDIANPIVNGSQPITNGTTQYSSITLDNAQLDNGSSYKVIATLNGTSPSASETYVLTNPASPITDD